MKAFIFYDDGESWPGVFTGSFEEAKAVCGWDTAQAIRVNGHVQLMVDEDGQRHGGRLNSYATFLAGQTIIGNAFLVLEH